ncbi:unnamed protein product [Bursaphelenchus okinawaensis]|uniref:TAR DNA-binding protein 43 N-terminal domain-containing protein n=1 Tax=Bursaphelenchus okinawaensis TaxID=465554 RepID=A0A811L341_9BILA|nr:unnamed protein product [Bursaphelenchus okinawaensis]CAG9115472.1 unnamed protein product [Bursaphelenchus okinawaensis]
MDSYIFVRHQEKIIKVTARADGTVGKQTIRDLFHVAEDLSISLYRGDLGLDSRPNVFLLGPNWKEQEFKLEIAEFRRSRPSTPDEGPPSKRPRIEEVLQCQPLDMSLYERVKEYALYFQRDFLTKVSVVPLAPRLAATYRHGSNSNIKIGDTLTVRSVSNDQLAVEAKVIRLIDELDTIVMDTEHDICDQEFIVCAGLPRKGQLYLMMGFSIFHTGHNHQSVSMGIIASGVNRRKRYIGTSGSFHGDSGAGCWSQEGRLIGMQVEVERVPLETDHNQQPSVLATGGRCGIIALEYIRLHIEDLIPPDKIVQFEE